MKFPSPKIILLSIVTIVVLGSFYYWKSNKKIVYDAEPTIALHNPPKEIDTDGDGLTDWEETLWKLDPKKADTDGDGTIDKGELTTKVGSNPNLPIFEDRRVGGAQDENLTETDNIAREIFYDYFKAKSDERVDEVYIKDLSNRTSNNIFSITTAHSLYKTSDLKQIADNPTPPVLAKYANDLVLTIKNQPIDSNKLSFVGITDAANPAFYEWAIAMSNFYANGTSLFISMQIPTIFLNHHIVLVNNLLKLSDEYKIVANGNNDPVSALSALARINIYQREVNLVLAEVKKYLDTHDIIFSNELGLYVPKQQ